MMITGEKRYFWNGLRGKITLQMLAAALIPMLILAVISMFALQNAFADIAQELDTAHDTLTEQGGESLSASAFLVSRRLDEYMLERIDDVAELTHIPSIIQAARYSAAIADAIGLPQMSLEEVEALRANQLELNTDRPLHLFLDSLIETTIYSEVFFTEVHGYNAAFSRPTSDFVQNDEEWWILAMENGLHIEDVAYDQSTGTYGTAISMRIDDPDSGEPLGVLKAALDIGRIQLLADEETTLLPNSEVLVFQVENGQRIADTAVDHDPALMLTEAGALRGSEYAPALLAANLQPEESDYAILYAEDAPDDMDQAHFVGFARTAGSNLYNRHGDFPGFGWVVAISQPAVEVLRAVNDLEKTQERLAEQSSGLMGLFAGIGVAAAIGGSILAAVQTRIIVNPITRLQQTAQQLSQGVLSARADISSQDEVGDLARAFNHMAGDLEKMVNTERENNAYLENTVSEYMSFVDKVSRGNLRMRLDLNTRKKTSGEVSDDLYQLGVNLNQMVVSLAEMAGKIREVTVTVASSAAEIQAAITQQTTSAAEQDVSVTQIAATLEEVRQITIQTAERAQMVADASQHSITVSNEGHTAVSDTVAGMQSIRQQVENIAETILILSEKTQQIGEIIETVNAIAGQSKLLALNASIEAARAGEEGKGFAVVASEVRQLAEQSREATRRVYDILNEIQQATNTAVMVTEEGSKGVESGMTLVNRAGDVIRNLAATIEDSARSASQIAASTSQQSNGVSQLSTAMAQIRQATVQTANSTRDVQQSISSLVEMANHLTEAAERYEI